MDLTEQGGARINRLGDAGLKNNFITASNGSLVSTGWFSFLCMCVSVRVSSVSIVLILFHRICRL